MRISDWSSDVCSSDLNEHTKMIWVETPTNPTLKIIDIEALAAVARESGALLAVDNTFATPYLQTPMDQIGRASCRERVCQYVSISVVAVSLKKNKHL